MESYKLHKQCHMASFVVASPLEEKVHELVVKSCAVARQALEGLLTWSIVKLLIMEDIVETNYIQSSLIRALSVTRICP